MILRAAVFAAAAAAGALYLGGCGSDPSAVVEPVGAGLREFHETMGTDWRGYETDCAAVSEYRVNDRGFCVPDDWR